MSAPLPAVLGNGVDAAQVGRRVDHVTARHRRLVPGQLPTIALRFLADRCPLGQLLQGTSECLAAREHGLEQVAVLFDPLQRLAHPEAARRHVLC
jgi:hypothetical protein